MFQKVFESIKDTTHIKNSLLKILITDEFKDTTITEEISKDINNFGDMMIKQISNYGKKLKGDKNSMRFSPTLLKASLCHYLSNKKGYEEFQKSSIMIYPSIHRLRQLAAKLRVKEGDNVKTYGHFIDDFVAKELKNGNTIV